MKSTVRKLRAQAVASAELQRLDSVDDLGEIMDGCESMSINICHQRAMARNHAEGQAAIGSILAGSGMQYASDGLSTLERNLLFDAWAAEQGYVNGSAATIHGNASLAQLGRLGMTVGGPFLDFADGAIYSWNNNTGMTPVNRASWAFNTGVASAAGGAAAGFGGYKACTHLAQTRGVGPGRWLSLAGAACGGATSWAGAEVGKRAVS